MAHSWIRLWSHQALRTLEWSWWTLSKNLANLVLIQNCINLQFRKIFVDVGQGQVTMGFFLFLKMFFRSKIRSFGPLKPLCNSSNEYSELPQKINTVSRDTWKMQGKKTLTLLESIKLRNCDALRYLVPFAQFSKRKKHPLRSVTLSKVVGFCLQLY